MNRRLFAAIVAVVLLAVLSAGGGVVAQDTSLNESGQQYSLTELRQDGNHYSQPSARIVPEESRVFWLEHRPVNKPWQDVGSGSSGSKLGEDATLQTNSIYLRTIHADDEPQSVDVTVVYWEEGERELGNGSTVPAATNQRVEERTVTIEPGWSVAEIDLPRHDDGTQVTMWLDEHPETARWTFEHQSVATTQSIPINTWGDFMVYGAMFIMIPAVAIGWGGSRKIKKMVQKAGEPPGHGFAYYAIIISLATVLLVFWIYTSLAELIVTIPPILGVWVGVMLTCFNLATHEGHSQKKLFWRAEIEKIEAFTDARIPSIGSGDKGGETDGEQIEFSEDMPLGQMKEFRVLDEGQDGMSIVRKGWYAFLARLKGGRAKVENADQLRTRFTLFGSKWDEVFLVDPDADELLEYEPPGLGFKTPEVDHWKELFVPGGVLAMGILLAWQATQVYGPVAWAALAVGVPYIVWKFAITGTDSYVRIDPAPAALRPALASMLVLQMGYHDAQSLEEAEEFAWKMMAKTDTEERETERRKADATLEGIFGGNYEADGAEAPGEEASDDADRAAADGGTTERDDDE